MSADTLETYESMDYARLCNPRRLFTQRFRDGKATLVTGETMPVDFVTDRELRTFQVRKVYCPMEHRWFVASKITTTQRYLNDEHINS